MSNRSFHMPYYCLLIGLLFMSIGYNIILNSRIKKFEMQNETSWVCPKEMKLIEEEIKRLDSQSHNILQK